MIETSSLILIITGLITFMGSALLMFYNRKLGLQIGEWIVFIFIAFLIVLRELINIFKVGPYISATYLMTAISVAIFILVLYNFWELFRQYSF